MTDTCVSFQALKWELEESDDNTTIYIHGLDIDNNRITVKIPDYKPYVYLELDSKIVWSKSKLDLLLLFLKKSLHLNYPVKHKLVDRMKNYYYKPAKFLWLAFNNTEGIKSLDRIFKKPFTLFGVGKIKLTCHEQKASPILQLYTIRKILPSGWINAKRTTKSNLINEYSDTFSTADIELVCSYIDISPSDDNSNVTNPKVISYDIETGSGDKTGNTFPDSSLITDEVICICATVAYMQDDEKLWKTYSLVNESRERYCNDINDGSELRRFKNEKDLLIGWTELIIEIDPDVITGYNTTGFDDKYTAKRADMLKCWPSFSKLGRIIGKRSRIDIRKWSSSAYGDQEFNYIDIPGRLHIDMFPVIFKDYTTLSSYTLDGVSEQFLGDHKINLPAKEMIQKWNKGDPEDMREIVLYCNKDTILPLKLMQKLNSWIGLTEMANVMMVQVFDLITRGQQIRVFSQQYYLSYDLGVVTTERWADYKPIESDKDFVGATVQDPKVGLHENVITYDFQSLYPTTIIAYNICYSTFIPETENPPEEEYITLEWVDHCGCSHDTAIRKTKPKKIICKTHKYRFYKANIKKGIVPILLENLLNARKKTKLELKALIQRLKVEKFTPEELKKYNLLVNTLDKRQNGYKISANSMYGGFGSDYSYAPFYQGAACTTAMGRKSIHDAIDFAYKYRSDTDLVYGDTDSCMIRFSKCKDLKECFEIAKKLEKLINAIFPKPMYLELEKIYSKYFLLSKKRYIGYIVDPEGNITSIDKKGVVIKRRDNCCFLRDTYSQLIEMVMNKNQKWQLFEYINSQIDKLLKGDVDLEKLIITKSIKDNYKNTNLPHVIVAEKMRKRGKYVASGTRVQYIFIKTDNSKDPQYLKAEEPDYYMANKDTVELDYMYYLEKQIINPIDEIIEVKFGTKNVLKNLFKLLKKDVIKNTNDYFQPKFKIE